MASIPIYYKKTFLTALIILVLSIGLIIFESLRDRATDGLPPYLFGIAGGIFAVLAVSLIITRLAAEFRYRATLKKPLLDYQLELSALPRRARKWPESKLRVVIGSRGALLKGKYYSWSAQGARLDHVSYRPANETSGQAGDLLLGYSFPNQASRQGRQIHLPVPAAIEPEALAAISQLRDQYSLH